MIQLPIFSESTRKTCEEIFATIESIVTKQISQEHDITNVFARRMQ
jgi:hypothetical protein